jgi:hypothetical protein
VRFWKPTIVYVTTHDDCTPELEKQGSDVWRILTHSKSAELSSDSMCTDHPRHRNPMGWPWGKSIPSQRTLKTEGKREIGPNISSSERRGMAATLRLRFRHFPKLIFMTQVSITTKLPRLTQADDTKPKREFSTC